MKKENKYCEKIFDTPEYQILSRRTGLLGGFIGQEMKNFKEEFLDSKKKFFGVRQMISGEF